MRPARTQFLNSCADTVECKDQLTCPVPKVQYLGPCIQICNLLVRLNPGLPEHFQQNLWEQNPQGSVCDFDTSIPGLVLM